MSLPEGSSFVQIRGHQWEAQQESHISKPEVRQFHLEIRLGGKECKPQRGATESWGHLLEFWLVVQ